MANNDRLLRYLRSLRYRGIAEDVPSESVEETTFGLPDELSAVDEAIVLLKGRPALRVRGGTVPADELTKWPDRLDEGVLKHSIASAVRIDSTSRWVPYHGTGFLVGPRLILTNRHVANALFADSGKPSEGLFEPFFECWVVPTVELPDLKTRATGVRIAGARWIHPYWDAALLELAEDLPGVQPLVLEPVKVPVGRPIVVVGHPYSDARNNEEAQTEIFGGDYGVERVQPGYLGEYFAVKSGRRVVHAITHDASTLGGNSGSPVVDAETGRVVALHFGGRYLERNYAVPTWALAADPQVADDLFAGDVDPPEPISGVADAWGHPEDPAPNVFVQPMSPEKAGQDDLTWYENTSEATLREMARAGQATLRTRLIGALGREEGEQAFTDLEELVAPIEAPKPLPDDAPEIVWIHGIMGAHLGWHGRKPRRLWVHPWALATADVASMLRLADNGVEDLNTPAGTWVAPNGHIGIFYDKAARRWQKRGFVVHRFSFDWRRSITRAADDLEAFLTSLALRRPHKRFALVGHSMGGLVSLIWAARNPDWASKVRRLIMMGSPVAGSFAPLQAVNGTYDFLRKLAMLAPFTSHAGLRQLARTSPGLVEMLPSPTAFPGADSLYARANWPAAYAPSQALLDDSLALKDTLAGSPLLANAVTLVSLGHGTAAHVATADGKVVAGEPLWAGDGTVPGRGLVLPGLVAYHVDRSHSEIPADPKAIQAVVDLLLQGSTSLRRVHESELDDRIGDGEAVALPGSEESTHPIGHADIAWLYSTRTVGSEDGEQVLARRVQALLANDDGSDELADLVERIGPERTERVLQIIAEVEGWEDDAQEDVEEAPRADDAGDGLSRKWADWLGGNDVKNLKRSVAVLHAEALRDVVTAAKKAGLAVKATASGHSDNDAGRPTHVRVDVRKLTGVSYPTLLLPEAHPVWTGVTRERLVRVGAGMTVKNLNIALQQLGLALPNMGSYDGQQIAGAILTGTHGSGGALGPLADSVRSIDMVDQHGALRRYENPPITDPTKFEGDVVTENWAALTVNAGTLGVVTSMVLEVVPAYDLAEKRVVSTWSVTKRRIEAQVSKYRHYEVLVHPYKTSEDWTTLETLRWIPSDDELGIPVPDEPEDPDTVVGDDQGTRNPILKLSSKIPRWLLVQAMKNRGFLKWSLDQALKALRVPWDGGQYYRDRSDRVLKLGIGQKAHGFEMAVPFVHVERAVAVIHEVAADYYALPRGERSLLTSPFSLRFVKASDAWIAPQNRFWNDKGRERTSEVWCMIEIPRLKGTKNPFSVTHEIERRLKKIGCRPHWGQSNDLQRGEPEDLYPRWPQFKAVYQRFNDTGRFSNAFTKRLLDAPREELIHGFEQPWDADAHIVALQRDGQLATSGAARSTRTQIARIFDGLEDEETLVLYAHGGLVDETSALAGARSLGTTIAHHGGAHPVFVVWKTGALEIAPAVIFDLLKKARLGRRLLWWVARTVGKRFVPGLDALFDALEMVGVAESAGEFPEEGLPEEGLLDALQGEIVKHPETQAELRAVARARGSSPGNESAASIEDPRLLDRQFLDDLFGSGEDEAVGLGAALKFAAAVARIAGRIWKRKRNPLQWTRAKEVMLEELLREIAVDKLGRAGWDRMKANAAGAYQAGHGGHFLVEQVARWLDGNPARRVHIGCHSAGSFHAGALIRELSSRVKREVVVESATFLAPACDHAFVKANILPNQTRIGRLRMFALREEAELDGRMIEGVYDGSLLTLVSGLFEKRPGWPVFGMQRFFTGPVAAYVGTEPNGVVWTPTAPDAPDGRRSFADRHPDFDDDGATRSSWLAVMDEPRDSVEEGLFDSPGKRRARQLARAKKTWRYDPKGLPPMLSTAGVPRPDRPSVRWISRVVPVLGAVAKNEVEVRRVWAQRHSDDTESMGGAPAALMKSLEGELAVHDLFMALERFGDSVEEGVEEAVRGAVRAVGERDREAVTQEVYRRFAAIVGSGLKPVVPKSIDDEAPVEEGLLGGLRAFSQGPHGRPNTFGEYLELFQSIDPPAIAKTWRSDEDFAWLRVAGPNPGHLRGISEVPDHFKVTDVHYKSVLQSDSLAAAAAEGRLFLGDWAVVGKVLKPGQTNGVQKFVRAPLALFAQPADGGPLRPIAIQCAQKPGPAAPVFTPSDGDAWLLAKSVVTVADANYHELISHLARTHLFVETALLATHRELAQVHPVNRLLVPHFEGTVFINHLARTNLVAPGGAIDSFFAGTIETAQALAVEGLATYDFEAGMLPNRLAALNIDGVESHPYREDSQLLWTAIESWVQAYVQVYYADDASVGADAELLAWVSQLREPISRGGLPGFPEVKTRTKLTAVLTHLVFVPSCQHAAVNFPQLPTMTYAPAFTGAGWRAAPTGPVDSDAQLEFPPPLQLARQQLDVLTLLGSVHHTKLGDYQNAAFPHGRVFSDPRVDGPLDAFRSTLRDIGEEIRRRNASRLRPYPYLRPDLVPMSINI